MPLNFRFSGPLHLWLLLNITSFRAVYTSLYYIILHPRYPHFAVATFLFLFLYFRDFQFSPPLALVIANFLPFAFARFDRPDLRDKSIRLVFLTYLVLHPLLFVCIILYTLLLFSMRRLCLLAVQCSATRAGSKKYTHDRLSLFPLFLFRVGHVYACVLNSGHVYLFFLAGQFLVTYVMRCLCILELE